MSGETTYEYGYDRLGLNVIFVISLIPIFLFEIDIRFTKRFLLIPFIEFFIFGAIQPMYLLIYAAETGIGVYIAELGMLFQLIGVLIAVVFERTNKKSLLYQPQLRAERA
jgi:hypothetical protein